MIYLNNQLNFNLHFADISLDGLFGRRCILNYELGGCSWNIFGMLVVATFFLTSFLSSNFNLIFLRFYDSTERHQEQIDQQGYKKNIIILAM